MKKLFTFFMALCMCLGFSAVAASCDAPADSTPAASTPADTTPEDSTPADCTGGDSTPDDNTPDDSTGGDTTPDTPSDIPVTEEEWNAAISDANFDNVTFTFAGAFDDGEEFLGVAAIAGDKALVDGDPLGAEFIPMLKSVYVNTALAIVGNFDDFTYDATQNVFVGKGDITYTVDASAMGYENVSITVKNVVVTLDANEYIATIACDMTQSFIEDGNPEQLVMNVTFTYSNYGTTVIE